MLIERGPDELTPGSLDRFHCLLSAHSTALFWTLSKGDLQDENRNQACSGDHCHGRDHIQNGSLHPARSPSASPAGFEPSNYAGLAGARQACNTGAVSQYKGTALWFAMPFLLYFSQSELRKRHYYHPLTFQGHQNIPSGPQKTKGQFLRNMEEPTSFKTRAGPKDESQREPPSHGARNHSPSPFLTAQCPHWGAIEPSWSAEVMNWHKEVLILPVTWQKRPMASPRGLEVHTGEHKLSLTCNSWCSVKTLQIKLPPGVTKYVCTNEFGGSAVDEAVN